jgi:hypothetical protein
MKVINSLLISIAAMALFAAPAYAVPSPPNAYYGTITSDGAAAPDGLTVSAKIGDIEYAVTTTSGGEYGYEPWFNVPTDDLDTPEKEGGVNGDTVEFYVKGVKANQEGTFAWGARTRLDLTVTGVNVNTPGSGTGSAGGGGGGGTITSSTTTTTTTPPAASTSAIQVIISGKAISFPIDASGKVLDTIKVTSGDGAITLTVPQGTVAKDRSGQPLDKIEVNGITNPPAAPTDARIVGLAYDFGPDGATFDPAMKIEFNYNADDLPPDAQNMTLAYYDTTESKWVEVESEVDAGNQKIAADIGHFTTYAMLARIVEVVPAPPVSASSSATTPAVQPKVTTAATATGNPTLAPAPAATTPVTSETPTTTEPFDWPLIGGLVGGVVIIALVLLFLWRRRLA